jgi:hypothetical protein
MTAKKKIPPVVNEKGVLEADIKQLMTPTAIRELKDLSPTMQQFLLRWQDKRDLMLGDQLKEELKEFLAEIHEADNTELCKNVAEIVAAQNSLIFSALKVQTESIQKIEGSVKEIKESVETIKADIAEIKDQIIDIENRVKAEDARITKLEEYVKPKWVAVRVGMTIIIAILVTLIAHYYLAIPLHKIFILP